MLTKRVVLVVKVVVKNKLYCNAFGREPPSDHPALTCIPPNLGWEKITYTNPLSRHLPDRQRRISHGARHGVISE